MANTPVSPDQAYQSALDRTNALIPQRQAFNQWQIQHTLDLEQRAQNQVDWERQQQEEAKKKNSIGSIIGGALSGISSGASMGSMAGPYGAIIGGVAGGVVGGVGGAYGGQNAVSGFGGATAASGNIQRNLQQQSTTNNSSPFTNSASTGVSLNQFSPAPVGLSTSPSTFTGTGGAQFSIPGSGAVANPLSNKTDSTEQDASVGPFTKKAKKLAKGK